MYASYMNVAKFYASYMNLLVIYQKLLTKCPEYETEIVHSLILTSLNVTINAIFNENYSALCYIVHFNMCTLKYWLICVNIHICINKFSATLLRNKIGAK